MTMLADFVRVVNAKKTFKILDDFEFVEFDDVSKEVIKEDDPEPDQKEIWAGIRVKYDGNIPESYRVLNFLIGEWVEENEEELTRVVHRELKKYFKENYPDVDASELENTQDSVIWSDQVDFMPRAEEGTKSMVIDIDLVVDTEEEEEE